MRFVCCFFVLLTVSLIQASFAQSSTDKKQVEFCRTEVEELEKQVKKLTDLLNLQSSEIQRLKDQVNVLIDENNALSLERANLEAVSVAYLSLALKMESLKDFQAAAEIYKLLIKTYPKSLEAAASRIKLDELAKEEANKR